MFTPLMEDVFSRDDTRVREILGELTGAVLDVGCGDGPYEEVLEPLAAANTITYLGVEPDRDRVRDLRERWPWATIEEGRAEGLNEGHAGRFDHVLVLRSWNHFADPARAIEQITRCLVPGGTLTIVDNVAFGLARGPRLTRRAEASASGFEHYRNDSAADAHRVASRGALALIERRDVGPATSNQWLLRYRLPSGTRDSPPAAGVD